MFEEITQVMDRPEILPVGATHFESTYKPRISILRLLRSRISPNFINLTEVTSNTVLKELIGTWAAQTASPGRTAFCRPKFVITAYGKPMSRVTVSLFSGDVVIAKSETDENGEVSFDLAYSDPGVYNYVAVIGERKPLILSGNPRAYPFTVTVWLIVTKSRNLTDRWARLQGRSFFRKLPVYFWREMPISVVGLAGRNVGYVDLVPCITGASIPMEIGVSAYCNTPEPYPPKEKCCEYAKNTWWRVDVYATNNPKDVTATLKGEKNHIGGDKINLDYHLKYTITSTGVTFNGKYLKQIRCDWERGTAPMDP